MNINLSLCLTFIIGHSQRVSTDSNMKEPPNKELGTTVTCINGRRSYSSSGHPLLEAQLNYSTTQSVTFFLRVTVGWSFKESQHHLSSLGWRVGLKGSSEALFKKSDICTRKIGWYTCT